MMALALLGCGSDGDGGGGGVAQRSAPSKEEYVAQVEKVCQRTAPKVARLKAEAKRGSIRNFRVEGTKAMIRVGRRKKTFDLTSRAGREAYEKALVEANKLRGRDVALLDKATAEKVRFVREVKGVPRPGGEAGVEASRLIELLEQQLNEARRTAAAGKRTGQLLPEAMFRGLRERAARQDALKRVLRSYRCSPLSSPSS